LISCFSEKVDFIVKSQKIFLDFFIQNDAEYIPCNKLEKETHSWIFFGGGGTGIQYIILSEW